MRNTVLLIPSVCLGIVCAGCSQDYSGDARFPLSGKVTVHGESIDVGSISFIPLDKGRVSGGPIENGAYAVTEAQGANAGKHKIEIHWQKRTGKKLVFPWGEDDERAEGLPAEFHTASKLTAEVGETQTTFDFDLKPDKSPAPKVEVPDRYRNR